MAALERFWVLFLFCFFSLKGGPADENKLWNDLCLCNWLDCVMLRAWNRKSGAARQGIYLGGVFLGKLGETENNNNKKQQPGGGGVCNYSWQIRITNGQPLRLTLQLEQEIFFMLQVPAIYKNRGFNKELPAPPPWPPSHWNLWPCVKIKLHEERERRRKF